MSNKNDYVDLTKDEVKNMLDRLLEVHDISEILKLMGMPIVAIGIRDLPRENYNVLISLLGE